MCVCMHVCTCLYLHKIHTHMEACVSTHMHASARARAHTHTHKHTHMSTQTMSDGSMFYYNYTVQHHEQRCCRNGAKNIIIGVPTITCNVCTEICLSSCEIHFCVLVVLVGLLDERQTSSSPLSSSDILAHQLGLDIDAKKQGQMTLNHGMKTTKWTL